MWTFSVFFQSSGLYLLTDIFPVNKDSTENVLVQVIATVFYSQPIDRIIAGQDSRQTKGGDKFYH